MSEVAIKEAFAVVLQAKQDKSVRSKQDTKLELGNGGEGRGVCLWLEGRGGLNDPRWDGRSG